MWLVVTHDCIMGKTEGQIAATAALRSSNTLLLATEDDLEKFHRKGRVFKSNMIKGKLSKWVEFMMRLNPSWDCQPSNIPGEPLEQHLAYLVGGEAIPGDGVFDVIKGGVAWEVKTIKNLRDYPITLSIMSREKVLGERSFEKAGPKEIARRLLTAVELKYDRDADARGVKPEHPRLAILARPNENCDRMFFWEEPYCLTSEIVDRLTWHKGQKGISGKLDGKRVISWYPGGGQLKYKPNIPGDAIEFPVPRKSVSFDEFYEEVLPRSLEGSSSSRPASTIDDFPSA